VGSGPVSSCWMARRSPARWLAPLCLVGAAAAVLITVNSIHSGGSSADTSTSVSTSGPTSTTRTTRTTSHSSHHARYYVVKDGDVLSAIAASTGVSLDEIEQLNPSVDAQSLHAGEKIKIAP
jgi:LysM repeat protein